MTNGLAKAGVDSGVDSPWKAAHPATASQGQANPAFDLARLFEYNAGVSFQKKGGGWDECGRRGHPHSSQFPTFSRDTCGLNFGARVWGIRQMPHNACDEPTPLALLVGIEQFNRGEFYECHDTLEELWMAEPGPIRDLYKGILQIGVAFYHLRAGRYRPAVWLLKRGSGYLRPFAPACMDIDVEQLLAGTARCLSEIERLGPDNVNVFDWTGIPKIKPIGANQVQR